MSENQFGDKIKELDLSHDEIDRLTKCMKDEKFRDLLREYAEEISDPENRKRYEEEIAMLEKDRGMDVKFINPNPGHVLKTSVNGKQKCFINICTNENLGHPRSRPSMQGKTRGMQWSIPHSVSQAREDVDKSGTKCMVYDVVFHPDTYYLLKKNDRFRKMIHDTALDAVERQFDVELDKVNIRMPKMTFKGLPMSSVIRTPHSNETVKDSSSLEDVDVRLRPPFADVNGENTESEVKVKQASKAKPYPHCKQDVEKAKKMKQHTFNGEAATKNDLEWGYIEPEYSITHRGYFNMQNYRLAPDVMPDTWPKELVITIDLPLLSAANSVNLEVFERRVLLESVKPAKYKLDFELPYPVDENKGFAKFDKNRHRLTVTLEVLPAPPPPKLLPFTCPQLVKECTQKDSEGNLGGENTNSEKVINTNKETTHTDPSHHRNNKKQKQKNVETCDQQKQAVFVEDDRRHYQQGVNWKDDDDLFADPATAPGKVEVLTKSSAFLIDMVMKYEGLIRRCPQYSFQQDNHFVTFVIEVPHIFEESLWYAVYDNMLQFCCLSECLDDDMVNSVFQLWIEFDAGSTIDPQRSRVDVSGNNAVFCLRKCQSKHQWHNIKAGFDKDNLEVRRFASGQNVCDLYTLLFKHADGVKASPIAVCSMLRVEEDLLIIQLKQKELDSNTSEKNPAIKENVACDDQTSDLESFEPDACESESQEPEVHDTSESVDSDDDVSPDKAHITVCDDGVNERGHVTTSRINLSCDELINQLDIDI